MDGSICRVAALAWLTTSVIAGLNLTLAWQEIAAWVAAAGSARMAVWLVVIPLASGLIFLLGYVTVVPFLQRVRGTALTISEGVHGPSAMPAVVPPRPARRIAVAIDFSGADTAALSQAVTLARSGGRGVRVILLHVVESGGSRAVGRDLEDQEARADQERLELYVSELLELGVEAAFDLGFGEPADELASLVRQHEPELVVLGSHGHRGIGDLIHGTTVERLRHRLAVPVLVVPANI